MACRVAVGAFLGALAAALLAGCPPSRANPDFCVQAGDDCGPDRVCNPTTRQCEDIAPECNAGAHAQCIAEDPLLPFCAPDGTCHACADAAPDFCATVDDNNPACHPDGDCVGCLINEDCDGNASGEVCDPARLACVECADHGDCADSGACDLAAQTCVDAAGVIRVNADTGDNTACVDDPQVACRSIGAAIDLVDDVRTFIVVDPGVYPENLNINGKSMTLIGPGARVNASNVSNQPALRVSGVAAVTVDGLELGTAVSGANADGVQCNGSGADTKLSLSRVTISNNADIGVQINNCDFTMRQSRVFLNQNGGLSLGSTSFVVTNNLIFRNGNDTSNFGGVKVDLARDDQVLDFNTIANNDAPAGKPSGLDCDRGFTAVGNIVYFGEIGQAPSLGALCTLSFSDIQDVTPKNNNTDVDPGFVNAAEDDYHLDPGGSMLIDVPGFTVDVVPADQAGLDIDGQRRPVNGLYDIGADEVAE